MVARVVLRKARTYLAGGVRWIKDVPKIVKGADNIALYQTNGYFHVDVLETKTDKPNKKNKEVDTEVEEKPKKKSGLKKKSTY